MSSRQIRRHSLQILAEGPVTTDLLLFLRLRQKLQRFVAPSVASSSAPGPAPAPLNARPARSTHESQM